MVKNLPANAGDMGFSPGPGRSHMLQRPNAAKKKKNKTKLSVDLITPVYIFIKETLTL